MRTPMASMKLEGNMKLGHLFFVFIKIGVSSFGGFMALISTIRDQWVEKEKKLDDQELVDGITLASFLPALWR